MNVTKFVRIEERTMSLMMKMQKSRVKFILIRIMRRSIVLYQIGMSGVNVVKVVDLVKCLEIERSSKHRERVVNHVHNSQNVLGVDRPGASRV